MNIVYVCLSNSIDWSGPPPTFAGVGKTVRDALTMAMPKHPQGVEDWLIEKDLEVRAYFTVRAFDMQYSPPREIDRPDLQRGGGPVQDA